MPAQITLCSQSSPKALLLHIPPSPHRNDRLKDLTQLLLPMQTASKEAKPKRRKHQRVCGISHKSHRGNVTENKGEKSDQAEVRPVCDMPHHVLALRNKYVLWKEGCTKET